MAVKVARSGAVFRNDIDKSHGARHIGAMSNAVSPRPNVDEEAAELAALTHAVDKSRANEKFVPHAEMRAWLLEIAAGNFEAEPPVSRKL